MPSPPGAISATTSKPDPAPFGIAFRNATLSTGLNYVWPKQARPMRNVEAFGTGCAFLDYDNDGWQDILLVATPTCRLYHNLHNGHFEDVTESSGLAKITGDWRGCAVGDYDGDGRLDILLAGYRRLALLKNMDGRQFSDSTVATGLQSDNRMHWGASAGFMDLTGTNKLDLVILNYVIFGPKEKQYCEISPGVKSGCPPDTYRPEFAEIWRNMGNGKFKSASPPSGIANTHGKCLALAFADINNDGLMDFYIGNDGTTADLLVNYGNLNFRNESVKSGVAFGALDHALAAMGADWADYDRDGRPDLAVTGFSDESYAVFHSLGKGLFENASDAVGISGPTLKPLGFGAKWLDFDNDGWPDLVFANGHVYDNVDQIDPLSTFRQPMMLFHNAHGKEFHDLVPAIGGEVAVPHLGRGLAAGDFDNDGRIDFLLVNLEGPPVLMHNETQSANHWITLDLRGAGQNRFAYGAQVNAMAGKETWWGQVSPASGYLSSSDPRIHFGLGAVPVLASVSIRWSDGHRETVHNVAADGIIRIDEGKGIVSRSVNGTMALVQQ